MNKFLIAGYKHEDLPSFDCTWEAGASFRRLWTDPEAFWVNLQDGINIENAINSILTTSFETISKPGDDSARALFRADSFPHTMDRIARSMTNSIRTGPNQTEAHGSVQVAEQHIHVRWLWMIMPASLVLLSVGFLATSMACTIRQPRVWKSSALPSLYHGLSGWDDMELCKASVTDMRQAARNMWADLRNNEDGNLKLVRAKD